MCWSAIPGQNVGIRAIHCDGITPLVSVKAVRRHSCPQPHPEPKATKPVQQPIRRYHRTVRVCYANIDSMSSEWLSTLESRRYRRSDHERGKRQCKSTHKPCWRGYEKY